jgi:hypothetical protein
MKVQVLTTPGKPGKFDSKSINWTDSSDRKWLMNHLHWAMNNDRSVLLSPATESN